MLGRLFTSWFAEQATEKLANSAAMQALAARTVAAQDALAAAAAAARADPAQASASAQRAVADGAETFFKALRREIAMFWAWEGRRCRRRARRRDEGGVCVLRATVAHALLAGGRGCGSCVSFSVAVARSVSTRAASSTHQANDSMQISSTEQGWSSPKFLRTSGCRTPSVPMAARAPSAVSRTTRAARPAKYMGSAGSCSSV